MVCFTSADVKRLLHNKYVAVLGDSIQRSVYKDLVKLLQGDGFLSESQLKNKGEASFANDTLVEGGEKHNRVSYCEVRQYRTPHQLVRFYFLTRVYSEYMESVLADFKEGPAPDVVILNSCIWDLIRYKYQPLEAYKINLERLFVRLHEVLSPECLVIWNMTMPVGFKDGEIPEYTVHNLRWDIIEGNFYSSTLANLHKIDVLDMHYHFRFNLCSRCKDAVHWNQLAHRKYTQILMAHIAQAWGVQPPKAPKVNSKNVPTPAVSLRNVPRLSPQFNRQANVRGYFAGPMFLPGYTSFDEAFGSVPLNFHVNHINASEFSFVDDSPILVSNFPPRGDRFDAHAPTFNNQPFSSVTISPSHLTVPGVDLGTYHAMPQEPWSGQHRLPKRRDARPMHNWIHPYHRPQSFSNRI